MLRKRKAYRGGEQVEVFEGGQAHFFDVGDVHEDAALSEFSLRYANTGFVAERLAPRINVTQQSDKYYTYDKSNLRRQDSIRHDKAEPKEVFFNLSKTSFYCEDYALATLVSGAEIQNADNALDPMADSVEFLMDLIRLDREKRVATLLTDTSVITNNVSLTNEWDDYTNGVPLTDIKTAKVSVYQNTLRRANTIVIPYEVGLALSLHPDILNLRKYTDPTLMLDSGLPSKIEGLEVLEAGAGENTATEGAADVLASIWGEKVLVGYLPPPGARLGRRSFVGCATFEFMAGSVKRAAAPRKGRLGSTYIDTSDGMIDEVVTASDAFYLIDNTLT